MTAELDVTLARLPVLGSTNAASLTTGKGQTMTDVSIIYCKPCGYEKRAVDAAAELRKALKVTAKLVPGKGGIFEVQVSGKVVAKRAAGHFPDTAEIIAVVSAALKGG
jgi:selenoprotein W-related protein